MKITTNLVQVDAVVTDKNGKIVTDLKPEEIEILEDGRKQKIAFLSAPPRLRRPPVQLSLQRLIRTLRLFLRVN